MVTPRDNRPHVSMLDLTFDATRVLARFEASYIPIPMSGCYVWMGCYVGEYGIFSLKNRQFLAHRTAYELHIGRIPVGLLVCHSCDVPCCVNPCHLFLGTYSDNVADMVRKGRALVGERNPAARLDSTDVRQIRALYSTGHIGISGLADIFGISPAHAWDVATGRRWSHLPDFLPQHR